MGVWKLWFIRIFSNRILGSIWYADIHFLFSLLDWNGIFVSNLNPCCKTTIDYCKCEVQNRSPTKMLLPPEAEFSLSSLLNESEATQKNISWTNLVTYSDIFLKDIMWIWMQCNLKKWWNSWLVLFIPKVPNIHPSYIYQNRNIITSHMVIHLYLTVAEALFCFSLSPSMYLWMLP